MRFGSAFFAALRSRPGEALEALFWFLTGRKQRGRNRLRLSSPPSSEDYARWISEVEPVRLRHLERLPKEASARIVVAIVESQTMGFAELDVTIASVRAQRVQPDAIMLVQNAEGAPIQCGHGDTRFLIASGGLLGPDARAMLRAADADYFLPVESGLILAPHAVAAFVDAVQHTGRPEFLYGDHDLLGSDGQRERPWFKPEWNDEMVLAQDYVSMICALRMDQLGPERASEAADAAAPVYALLLDATRAGGIAVHVPHVLAHVPINRSDLEIKARAAIVTRRIAALGARAEAIAPGILDLVWPVPADPPLVSVIVPTRDRLDLLRKCIDGVLNRTHYALIELIIVDNDSKEPCTRVYLDKLAENERVRVVRFSGAYNFPAINAVAVSEARGTYLCLLNNDTEVVSPEWLARMISQAVRTNVGAVGAKLVYPDGSIQHAGVVVGLGGIAGHAHRFQRPGDVGYFNRVDVQHYVSAVTAACLVVEKRKFEAVGGMDADTFPVAFNDTELCLKLGLAGWSNVYEPRALLIHHESKTRKRDIARDQICRFKREVESFRKRWKSETYVDPLHHPELDRDSETYRIAAFDERVSHHAPPDRAKQSQAE